MCTYALPVYARVGFQYVIEDMVLSVVPFDQDCGRESFGWHDVALCAHPAPERYIISKRPGPAWNFELGWLLLGYDGWLWCWWAMVLFGAAGLGAGGRVLALEALELGCWCEFWQ